MQGEVNTQHTTNCAWLNVEVEGWGGGGSRMGLGLTRGQVVWCGYSSLQAGRGVSNHSEANEDTKENHKQKKNRYSKSQKSTDKYNTAKPSKAKHNGGRYR